MTGESFRFLKGELIKISGGIFTGHAGIIVEDSPNTATFCWVFVDGEPQWIHALDCEVCDDKSS